MTNFIPIFPLGIVVFPGEELNLHIFEPRYKQLVKECAGTNKPFGIPAVIKNNISALGTLVKIKEITKTYEDGQMDVKTEGIRVFKILEIIKELPEKLFSGAIVTYPENIASVNNSKMKAILKNIRALHVYLGVEKSFSKPDESLCSFDVAHHAGLSIEEEYQLLELPHELQRLEFLRIHLSKILPVMEHMDLLKGRIKLNGHFKNLEGFKFS